MIRVRRNSRIDASKGLDAAVTENRRPDDQEIFLFPL